MANIQVTHDSSAQNARSESNIAINPNNPLQIVASSKKFSNILTYTFTLAIEYSNDGGQTWHDSAPLSLPGPSTIMTDPTLAWDDSGNVFLVGLGGTEGTVPPVVNADTGGIIAMYKSTDGGKTWSAPYQIPGTEAADKQWAAGDSNPSSPYHGNVYAVWDKLDPPLGMAFAKTEDHGATWVGAGGAAAGSLIATGTSYPEIDVSANGYVYVVSLGADQIEMIVSTDGGNTFLPSAIAPATGITTLPDGLGVNDSNFSVFPGGSFRVLTDPTACSVGPEVFVAWADYREGISRIYFAHSIDAGTTWTSGPSGQPLLTQSIPSNFQHFHPQIVVDPNGVVGCTFYEFGPKPTKYLIDVIISQSFDHGSSFNYFIVTDQPWDPSLDAPLAEGFADTTFIGDYFGLDASATGFYPLWTDTRTHIQELFTAILPEKGVEFIIDQSTIGQDEVDTLRKTQGPSAIISDAFRVVVDGFTAAQLGVSSPASTLAVASPTAGMTVLCTGNSSATGAYGPQPQRFTFFYNLDFGTDSSDPAFSFSGTEFLTLNVTVNGVSAAGQIELIKQPDPYLLHGDPPWLSVDLRVFPMRQGQSKFGQPMGGATTANNFIQQVMLGLTKGNGTAGGQSFSDETVLPSDEETSALYLTPNDENNVPVFNFALARVRYIGLIGATTVRVFFRLFAAQQTTGIYDYPPGEQYRRATTNPQNQPIPLAGVILNEYVTIPCFALPRIDTTVHAMDQQTDSQTDGSGNTLGNIQTIVANAAGSEVDTFFGCWLDINQPFKPDGVTPNNVLPQNAVAPLDGPFTDPSNPPQTLGQAILRNLHQCIIAEIAFDPATIPPGTDPSNWDKLAQRNIAWSPVGSAQAVTTFEIRPTTANLPAQQQPDELMIDWGTIPVGSVASIYLPAVTSDAILSMASRMYTYHGLTRLDGQTVQCKTGGVTYLPIPPGTGSNYAGLLTITLPSAMRRARTHTVVVRQVTNAFGDIRKNSTPKRKPARQASAVAQGYLEWRKVIGAFQISIPVSQKSQLLRPEERQLSVLKWNGEAIPKTARWYPVFQRYLEVIGGRVTSFGGNPVHILPSPLGNGVPGLPGYPGHPGHPGHHPGHPGHPVHPGHPGLGEHERPSFTGKVVGIIFDHFGDFEGFILETDDGEHHRFNSHESHVHSLVDRAWMQRILITVIVRHDHQQRPLEIILRGAPTHKE